MSEFAVQDRKYRSGKLSAIEQFHIVRRIAPVIKEIGHVFKEKGQKVDPMEIFGPVADALSRMSDQDSEYVLKTCLKVCQVEQGGRWVPLCTSTGAIMFDDLQLAEMIQIAWSVLQENLANFTDALPQKPDA